MGITNGVCDECGSGVLDSDLNKHIRDDIPCVDNPRTSEFWWENHARMVREGKMSVAFPRNSMDIDFALGLVPEAHLPLLDAIETAQKYHNVNQYQAGTEAAIRTAIARLLDAGVLQRGPNS